MRQASDVTILVVDDEAPLRKALIYDFKRRGFNVLDAGNGNEAFELVKSHKVSVILTDVRMPGGDGVELLDRVKALDPAIPVLMFITGFADLTLEDAYDKGADAVFSKPFDRKALLAAVIRVVTVKEELWGIRKSERIEVEFDIELKAPELSLASLGKVLNIGRGGIFVTLECALPGVGSKVDFQIEFDRGALQHIHGSGVVRWIRAQTTEGWPRGCGIEFEHLSNECRKQVIELINDLKTKSYIPKI